MTWYPQAGSYYEYLQNSDYVSNIKNEISKLSSNINDNLSSQTRQLIANQNQIAEVYVNRLARIENAIVNGLDDVTAAIVAFHADFNEKMEMVIGRLDLINENLKKIVYALHNPEEMKVNELYRKGCRHTYEGLLDVAVKEFEDALLIDDTDFPTHFELGKLYLIGYDKETRINVCNLKKANFHLLQASTRYGRGKLRSDPSSREIVSVAYLYASRSYYVQMQNPREYNLLDKAIELAIESTNINPNLSQSYFYLARYYSVAQKIHEMKSSLIKAIEIDPNYFLEIEIDKTFDSHKSEIQNLQKEMWEKEFQIIKPKMEKAKSEFHEIERYSFSESRYRNEYTNLLSVFNYANKCYDEKNYFGFLEAKKTLKALNI